MSKAKVAHLLASVWIPIGEPLKAFADRLTRLMPGFTFEEETTGRYEEVPAYLAERGGMEFVLFGVPEDEVSDEYVLEFDCRTELLLEELLERDAGGFVRQFVHERVVNERGFLDYSDELAKVLVQHGIPGCKPIRPVGE
jgi:hypothetical protein